jgi:hypothetical protein
MMPAEHCVGESVSALSRWTGAFAVFGLSLALCADVDAEDGSGGAPGEAVVMIAERRSEAETAPVLRAVQSQLSDLAVALQLVWVDELPAAMPDQIVAAEQIARGSHAVAVFWCDLRAADRIYLYFAAPKGGRVLVRELSGAGEGGLAEALAIIVRSSVEAVLAGGEIGVVVAPPPPEAKPEDEGVTAPKPPPPSGPGRVLALTVGYGMDVLSGQRPAVHAVVLGLEVRLAGPLSVEFGYLFSFPFTQEESQVELTLRRHPAWLGLRGAWLTGDVARSASLWLQMDVVTEEVRALSPAVEVEAEGTEVLFSLVPLLRAGYVFADRFELFVAAGADIPFRRVRYVVGSPTGPLEIFATWPVRPRLMVGLCVGLW